MTNGDVVERLEVVLEANADKLAKDADKAVKQLEKDLERMGDKGERAFDKIGKGANRIKSAFSALKGPIVAAAAAIGAAAVAVKQLTDRATEAARSQFNLASSVAAANREFGASVGTQDSWRRNIEDLGDQLRIFGSRDVNDATSRLIDMTKRLGLTEAEMVTVLQRTADLSAGKVNLAGGVERVSAALRGEAESAEYLGLTLSETAVRQYAEAHGLVVKELTDEQRVQIRLALLLNQTNELQGRAAQFAETRAGQEAILNSSLEDQAAILGEQLLPLRDGYNQLLISLAGETEESASLVSKALAAIAASFITLGATVKLSIDNITGQAKILAQTYTGLWDAVTTGTLTDFWSQQRQAMDEFVETHSLEAAGGFSGIWTTAFDQVLEGWQSQRKELDNVIGGVGAGGGSPFTPDISTTQDEIDKIQELLLTNQSELLDLQADTNTDIEKAEQEHGEAMLEITEDFADKRTDAIGDALEDIAELEKESAADRQKIIEGAREDLLELEQDTDEKLSDERAEFETDERRRTEDHLTEMRRLRLGYLDDLQDAVKARDAGAIRDLMRRNQREQQERTEDFDTRESREQQDQDEQLRKIRESEAKRAAEIMAARERELQEVATNEAEKRAEIEASLREQLIELNQAEQEKLTAEQTSYDERRAELENALLERLELVARSLAEEDDINREGAQAILETLANYFGVGGEIDNLMTEFQDRMNARITISTDLKTGGQDTTPTTTSGGFTSPGRAFADGGSMIATKPTLALFGEKQPEAAFFAPLSQLQRTATPPSGRMEIEMSGSAPPGIRSADREAIAGVIVAALREAGLR